MDVIFDIDGTLANAEHRLHHIIPDPNVIYESGFKKDWDTFLSDEQVAKDTPIYQSWLVLWALMAKGERVIFITGRPEAQREVTLTWLFRCGAFVFQESGFLTIADLSPQVYMRTDGDRRPSHTVKEELLNQARKDGFEPTLVFEDRADDTAMWRRNGLLCCQVAEGNY